MEQQRPLGITVLGIIGAFIGGWHLLLAMFALSYTSSMVMISAFAGFPPAYGPAYAGLANVGWVLLAAGAAVLLLVGSLALLTLKQWAYWLTVVGAGISLLTHVLPGLQGVVTGSSTVGTLLSAGILIYLFLPNVRRAFFQPTGELPNV